jgi:hypothetical protein
MIIDIFYGMDKHRLSIPYLGQGGQQLNRKAKTTIPHVLPT